VSVADRLRALRKHLGLTQDQLANASELERVVIVQIENARNQASSYAVRKALAKGTGFPVERLSSYLDDEVTLDELLKAPANKSARETAAEIARQDGVHEDAIRSVLVEPDQPGRSTLWWAIRMKMREAQLVDLPEPPPDRGTVGRRTK
jgi:transcriptional regulator with XRE-family HTH domain